MVVNASVGKKPAVGLVQVKSPEQSAVHSSLPAKSLDEEDDPGGDERQREQAERQRDVVVADGVPVRPVAER